MKNSSLIAFLIIVFLIMGYAQAPYVSCQEPSAGEISSTTKVDPKEQLAQAKNLVIKKEYQKAKEILNQILELEKDKPPRPYISGNVLYMYVHNQAEIIAFSGVHTLQDKKQRAEAMGKIWPEVLELEKTETWGNIIFDLPVAPEACQLLAYIDIDERNIEEAFKHLDQAVRLWSRFLQAHGEYVFILIQMKKYDEAKERAKKALEFHNSTDNEGASRIYRHLGYIAIEENELDIAEQHFNKSLELTPNNQNALQELEYIKQLRDKK